MQMRAEASSPLRLCFLWLTLHALPSRRVLRRPLETTPFNGRSDAGPYGDFVTMVDHEVGRVLTALEEQGFADNTLVIFTSDNGAQWIPTDIELYGHRANANWRGQKADIYEGGHRVPFLVRWPGHVAAGTVRDGLLGLTDIHATLAGILGVELPGNAAEDSVDQSSVLLGQSERALRQDIIHHSSRGLFSLRKENWKLVLGRGSGGFTEPRTVEVVAGEPAGQLYDLAADPGETNNLYMENQEKVEELSALLTSYREQGHSR